MANEKQQLFSLNLFYNHGLLSLKINKNPMDKYVQTGVRPQSTVYEDNLRQHGTDSYGFVRMARQMEGEGQEKDDRNSLQHE